MAQAQLVETKLRIVFQTGIGDDGKPVFKAKTYNVKREATTEQLYQAAEALYTLCEYNHSRVERLDNSSLSEPQI